MGWRRGLFSLRRCNRLADVPGLESRSSCSTVCPVRASASAILREAWRLRLQLPEARHCRSALARLGKRCNLARLPAICWRAGRTALAYLSIGVCDVLIGGARCPHPGSRAGMPHFADRRRDGAIQRQTAASSMRSSAGQARRLRSMVARGLRAAACTYMI